jgi:PKD repeat protein
LGSTLLTGIFPQLFLAQISAAGQVGWVQTAADDGSEMQCNGLFSTDAGALYLCGAADAPSTFGNITLTEPTSSSCCLNAYVALLADSCTALLPQAGFTFAPTADPQEIQFTSTASQASSVSWDFGDGRSSTDANPVLRYFVPGLFQVCQFVSNACGTDTLCQWVAVNCAVSSDFDFELDTTNLTVTFTNLSTNASSYSWDFGDGGGDTATNPVHQYSSLDTFQVTLIAFGPCGIDTTFAEVIPACEPTIPAFSFELDTTNLTVAFTNLSTNASSYDWFFGDGGGDTATNPVHQYSSLDTFQVTLIAFGACGIDTTFAEVIPACEPSTPAFSFELDTTNLTVAFTNLSTNANSYSWDFGDGNGDTAANPVHQYEVPGTYSVSLINYGPCIVDTAFATITPLCIGTTAGFTYQTDSLALHVTFDNRSTNADKYYWDFGDGGFDTTSAQPTHVYPSPNYYEVSLIAKGPCEIDTFRQVIRPDCNAPRADLATLLDSASGTLTLVAEVEGATSFGWDFGGGTADPTSLSPEIVFPAPGLYTVTLELSNLCGTATYETQVYLPPGLVSRQALRANFPQWKAYPNPTTRHWWVETEAAQGEVYALQVVDLWGREVFSQRLQSAGEARIAIYPTNWAAGMYWLRISSESGQQVIALRKD